MPEITALAVHRIVSFVHRISVQFVMFAMLACVLSPTLILADADTDLSSANQNLDLNSTAISWLPGEKYDARFGTLNYSRTDLSIPGNGKLPIEIVRTFYQRPRATDKVRSNNKPDDSFGMMGLSIPRVVFLINSHQPYVACTGVPGYGFFTNEPTMRFMDGARKVTFFAVTDKYSRLAQSNGVSGIDFISKDNWGIKCLDDIQDGSILGPLAIDVHSPDGTVYRMRGKKARRYEEPNNIVYRVEEVSDAYGNTLTYEYVNYLVGRVTKPMLISISANDGRRVDLTYKRKPRDSSRPSVSSGNKPPMRIATISSNGEPNPRVLEYAYSPKSASSSSSVDGDQSDIFLTVTENKKSVRKYGFKDGKIGSITYPTGGKILYQYEPKTLEYAGLYKHYMLAKRISQPDGTVFRFEHKQDDPHFYSRLIRTPSGAKEYYYKAPPLLVFDRPKPYTPESGKLLRYRVFENPEVSWPVAASEQVLLERTYRYKEIHKIYDIEHEQAASIVPDRITTRMNKNANLSSYKTKFTKEYQDYDFRGFPTKLVESTGGVFGRKTRTTHLGYQHDGFDRWIVGKTATLDVDGKDFTRFEYTRKGDIKSVIKNDKTIVKYSYHEFGQSKGEIETVTNGHGGRSVFSGYVRGQPEDVYDEVGRRRRLSIATDGTLQGETRFGSEKWTSYAYDEIRRIKKMTPARERSLFSLHSYSGDNRTLTRAWDSNETLILDEFARVSVDARKDWKPGRWSTQRFFFDAENRLVAKSYPDPNTPTYSDQNAASIKGSRYTYDALGRLIKVIRTAENKENTVRYLYGAAPSGNQTITRVDGRGLGVTTEYVSYGGVDYGWPVSITEADGSISTIERNSLGQVKSHTRGGMTTSYQYNAQNLVSHMTRPDDSLTTFEYYDSGLLSRRVNKNRSVRYYYYPDLQVKQEDHIDDEKGDSVIREYLYDGNGNMARMYVNSNDGRQLNHISYAYDEADNLLAESLVIDGIRMEMKYEYDGRSNRKSIQYPSGNRYALNPNAFGDPRSIKQDVGGERTIYDLIEYHPNNMASLLRRNGHQVRLLIDQGQRPKENRLEQYSIGKNEALASRRYSYDNSNNVSSIYDVVHNRYSEFRYDNRNRLKTANISDSDNWSFVYKDNDDIESTVHGENYSAYTYEDSTSRLRKVVRNGVTRRFEYDRQGNMVRHDRVLATGGIGRMGLDFNAANQVIKMSDGTRFAYDARGIRVKKDLNGPIYSFYDSSEKLIYRNDAGAGVTSEYFYINGNLVARHDEDQSDNVDAGTGPSASVDNTVPQQAENKPDIPSTLWPTNDGVEPSPVYKWAAVPGATHYEIVTRRADTEEQFVYERNISASQAGCSQGSGSCRHEKPDSKLSGANRWQVRSQNSKGYSQWSEWRYFSIKN